MQTIPIIRKATVEDIDILVRLRLVFQQESRNIEDKKQLLDLDQANRRYFAEAIPTGTFHIWVAEVEQSGFVVKHRHTTEMEVRW